MNKAQDKIYENRIFNLQWAGATSYDFDNFIIGENIDGNPDFYLNLIIGIAVKYLGHREIENLINSWTDNPSREKYDLGLIYMLEDFAYNKELGKRPVLESLRKSFAEKFLADKYDLQRRSLAIRQNQMYRLEVLRMKEILGVKPGRISKKDLERYKNLRLPEDTDRTNLEERVLDLFKTYLGYKENDLLNRIPFVKFSFFESAGRVSLERSIIPASFAGKNQKSHGLRAFILNFKIKKRRESLDYIEKTFGRSLFDEKIRLGIERDLCTGGHKKSRLFYTRGITENDKYLDQDLNKKAIERHLLKFKANQASYMRAISLLSKEIKLKINLTSSFDEDISARGKLASRLAYKAEISDRAKIFKKKNLVTDPSMKVDLLIDGSASLLDKESEVAIEAYILSKSLENNSILVRVISFQTVGDFTILTILKDYDEKAEIKKIFRFKTMGWNRDGLVFRAYRAILDKDIKDTLSIILTDANPQDLKPLITKGFRFNKTYQDQVGLEDAKKNINELRKKGLKIAAIISGDHTDNARDIYRSDFIKIDKASSIARACSKFIKKQISSIEKS